MATQALRPHILRLFVIFVLIAPLLACEYSIADSKPPKVKAGPAVHNRKGRATIVVDGAWQFATDPHNEGTAAKWQSGPSSANAKETSIPALWSSSAAPGYTGTAWYWRTFSIPADWKGQTLRIRFHAVAENARVWLNGTLLGEHSGGATPFEFNVTGSAKIGQDNLVALRVEGDAKRGAGIWQGVELLSHDEAYIDQEFTAADQFGRISADVALRNTSIGDGDATLDCRVIDITDKSKEVNKSNQNLRVTPGLNVTNFITSVHGGDLHRWDLSNPFIYGFQLAFRQDKDILDTDEAQFGFRTLGLKDGQITLNGDAISLSAIAPKLDLPVVIATSDDTDKANDMLQRLKRAGVTTVYLEAAHPEMLRLADTLGILVVEGPRRWLTGDARDAESRELVLRDRNHPCILAWSLAECTDQFARSMQQLDPTRFLLTGDSAKKLWAPSKHTPEQGPLPAGLLPIGR